MIAVKFYCFLLIGILMLAVSTALAITDMNDRKSFIIPRAESPPKIDGTLDDDVWRNAAAIDDFHQIDPGDGVAPTEITIVRVLYDNDYLSIAADLRDRDPDKIQVTQMIQGRLFFSDDRFWVTFDSFNSKRNDCLFHDNANGVRRETLLEKKCKNYGGVGGNLACPIRAERYWLGHGNSHPFQVDLIRPKKSQFPNHRVRF